MCACVRVGSVNVLGVFDLSTVCLKLFSSNICFRSSRLDSLHCAAFICAYYRISNGSQSEYVNGVAFKLCSITNQILFQFQAHHQQFCHRLSGNFPCHETASAAITRISPTQKHRTATSQLRPQIWFSREIKHIHRGSFLLLIEQCRFESAPVPHQSVPRWRLEPPFAWI